MTDADWIVTVETIVILGILFYDMFKKDEL